MCTILRMKSNERHNKALSFQLDCIQVKFDKFMEFICKEDKRDKSKNRTKRYPRKVRLDYFEQYSYI